MKSGLVCMNFVRLVSVVVKMYAASVGWLPPASLSMDWSPVRGRMRKAFCGLPLEMPLSVLSRHQTLKEMETSHLFFHEGNKPSARG